MVVHAGRRGRIHHRYAHAFQSAFRKGTHIQPPVTLVIVFSRSRTGVRGTDTILNRFIRGAIQTGLFAGIFSVADLITLVVLPKTSLYAMFTVPIGRIYTSVSTPNAMEGAIR